MLPPALALLVGLTAASSSVIFIKESRLDPVLLSSGRLWVAGLSVLPLLVRDTRRHPGFLRKNWRRTLWPAGLLSVHFASWILGARLTPAVNSSLLVNMIPVVTPLLLLLLTKEVVTRREAVATLIAMSGALWLGASDYRLEARYFLGDITCFGSMVLFASYLVLARANRDFPALWLYMGPIYLFAVGACALASLVATDFGALPWEGRELWLLVGLGVIPTIVGHGCLNYAMKHLRGQIVGIANLGQVISAGVLAYFLLDEVPASHFYPASLVIAVGVVFGLVTPRAASSQPASRGGRLRKAGPR